MVSNIADFPNLDLGLKELFNSGELSDRLMGRNTNLELIEGNVNELSISENSYVISFSEPVNFYYLFGKLINYLNTGEKPSDILKTTVFDDCGVMLDASRNAVPSVEGLKVIIRKLALMGLNMLMLYTEDTYELDNYPYFGYMRGRYSKAELKEIDDYAYQFGIEIIPCIQTLGHLEKALRWPFATEIKDTDAVLLAEDDKSFEFVKQMIKESSSVLRSRRIHLGMDEAFGIGLGRYLSKNGYKDMGPILKSHMEKVQAYCRELGLESMIWSDMPFRAVTSEHIYYIGKDDVEVLKEKSKDFVPHDLSLVYWDYYHNVQEEYEEMIRRHKFFGNKIYFAGGAWNWNGIAPNLQKAYHTTDVQLKACDNENVRSIFCTCWQDNGAETNHFAILSVLLRYSFYKFHGRVPNEVEFNREIESVLNLPEKAYQLLSQFDIVEGVIEKNLTCANTAKYLLYQDLELALFDKNILHLEGKLNKKYDELAKSLNTIYDEMISRLGDQTTVSEGDKINLSLLKHYIALAKLLSKKAELGLKLRQAYQVSEKEDKDRNLLFKDVLLDIDSAAEYCKELKLAARDLWYLTSKKHGFESFDIRLSALLGRLETVKLDIKDYISGKISKIETLEDELLTYNACSDEEIKKQLNENQWHHIVSPNPVSC